MKHVARWGMLPLEVMESPVVSDAAKVTYAALASFTADGAADCWPKMATIAARVCKTIRTTRRLVSELESAGWIVRGADDRGWRTYTLKTNGTVIRIEGHGRSEVTAPPVRSDRPPRSEVTASIIPEGSYQSEKKQLPLLAPMVFTANACADGSLDGIPPADLLGMAAAQVCMEAMRAASWGERARPVSSQEFRRAWRQLVLTEGRKPSEIAAAIRGMRADEWRERRSRNGWAYLARGFDRWVALAGAASTVGPEPRREDYATHQEWVDATSDHLAAKRLVRK